MNFLFIHGGPGLNSNPEKELLSSYFTSNSDQLFVWNEPLNLREEAPEVVKFQHSCSSLKLKIISLAMEGELTIIAHSFGAFILDAILPSVEELISKIILITPVSNLSFLDRNIISNSLKFYENTGSSEARVLKDYFEIMNDAEAFNEERFNAILTAASHDKFNDAYWSKTYLMADYYLHFAEPKYQFSMANFKSIRETCRIIHSQNGSSVETVIIYGKNDPFILSSEADNLQSLYPNSSVTIFNESAHYPHIEERKKFLSLILESRPKNTSTNTLNSVSV